MTAFAGCNQPVGPDQSTLGYDYFPLQEGTERTYQVVRIEYIPGGEIDTTTYQLKEIIGAPIESNGENSYRLERFKRQNANTEWAIDEVWSARRNTYQAIVVENNIPIIKMSFPIGEDRRWDGNAMNNLPEDEYKMKNLSAPYVISGLEFKSTLEVYEDDLLDPCKISSDNYHIEVFAKGVGLVYKYDIDRKYVGSSGCEVEGNVEFGLVVEQNLIDFVTIE